MRVWASVKVQERGIEGVCLGVWASVKVQARLDALVKTHSMRLCG